MDALSNSYDVGMFGEQVACDLLEEEGWTVLDRRVRTRWGELDIVARRNSTVAFCEVKTAGRHRFDPAGCVDRRSQQRIRRAAVAWMSANPRLQSGVRRYRFDVLVVHRGDSLDVQRVEHVRNAF